MMRKHLIMSTVLAATAFGSATLALANPLDRARAILRQRPVPTPAPPNGTQTPKPSAQSNNSGNTAAIKDQGVHNAVHAAHQKQIVFTRTDLGISAITEGAIATDFTLGQPMFFRVFTERSAVNAIAAANNKAAGEIYADGVRYAARFTIDGQLFETSMFPWGNSADHKTWTTWRGQFINTINAQRTPGSDVFMEMLSKATAAGLLKPGKHSVKMEVIPETSIGNDQFIKAGVVASGTFNLSVPAGIFQASNTAVCGPGRGGAGSAALEARALSEARRVTLSNQTTPVRAVGIGQAWDVERNEITGIPIKRKTDVAILARGAKFCTANVHSFYEDYMGGGSFGTSTGSISLNTVPRYIPCGCLG